LYDIWNLGTFSLHASKGAQLNRQLVGKTV